jgi:hypothetical protein
MTRPEPPPHTAPLQVQQRSALEMHRTRDEIRHRVRTQIRETMQALFRDLFSD